MARITRKELKTDKFALEVEHTVDFFEEHRQDLVRYGAVALVLILIGVAVYYYRSQQHDARQAALAKAILVQEATVGQAPPGNLSFPTQQAKDEAAVKAFTEVASKYPGSDEGMIAKYYLGCIAADQGKLSDAAKAYEQVADSGSKQYSALAKFSLAQIYIMQGKNDQGEKLLRWLVDNPSVFVSKSQATIALARAIAATRPNEALNLVEPLRTSPDSAVSQTAITTYAELSATH